jgi:AraC-like DNA-binding protein
MRGRFAEALTVPPAPQLASFVGSYSGSRFEGFSPRSHLGLPSRHLTVVVSLDAPLIVAAVRAQAFGSFTALAAGLHTRAAVVAHDGSGYTVSFELTPAGARSLLGLPAGELAGAVVDLEELLGLLVRELAERMAAAADWDGRFAVLDDVLTRRAGRMDESDGAMAGAWHRVVESGGTVRIDNLADEIGYSRRHLTKRFTREYGLTPKEAARVVRFERSWLMLRRLERTRRLSPRDERPSLAQVAASCGYYDQAHLAREWNDLAGLPPSAWLDSEELPFVQDSTAEAAIASAA